MTPKGAKYKGWLPDDIPPVIYKYRSWDIENHRRLLTHGEIYFASPKQFNDPFDCAIPPRYDKLKASVLRKKVRESLKLLEPQLKSKELDRRTTIAMKEKRWQDATNILWAAQDWNDSLGIFTASERRNSILMWSLYSEDHTGICVGLNTENLNRFLSSYTHVWKSENLVFDAKAVQYVKEMPVIIPNENSEDTLMPLMVHKSHEWEYEKEYRLICLNRTGFVLALPGNVIEEIVIGMRASESNISEIRSLAQEMYPHARLCRAQRALYSYEIEFEELN